jgi:GntR family transcriptional regulator
MISKLGTLALSIDFRSSQPVYKQIADQVRLMIVNGTLKSGDQLPTVRTVADTVKVNFNTVAKAYRILDEEGLILTHQGRGSFISDPVTEIERQHLRRQTLDALTERYLTEVHRLGFSVEDVSTIFEDHLGLGEVAVAG